MKKVKQSKKKISKRKENKVSVRPATSILASGNRSVTSERPPKGMVPGIYMRDSSELPKKCRHVGTKIIKFGHKQTGQGFIQRYFCYGCNGTFTTAQQQQRLDS